MPARSSHLLQPLDVVVFGPFKGQLQTEVHRAARLYKVIDMFAVVKCITRAYRKAVMFSNVRSGFYKTGTWESTTLRATMKPLSGLLNV